eukprot:scaffold1362_cov163-Amphora_coffeaeformis.AAC.9
MEWMKNHQQTKAERRSKPRSSIPFKCWSSSLLPLALLLGKIRSACATYCRAGVCSDDQGVLEIVYYMHVISFLLFVVICMQCYSACRSNNVLTSPQRLARYNAELHRQQGFVEPPTSTPASGQGLV